jgi:hypothetical protein
VTMLFASCGCAAICISALIALSLCSATFIECRPIF